MERKSKPGELVVTDVMKADMFEDFVKGLNLKDVSKKYNIHYQTVLRYSKVGDWKAKKLAITEEIQVLEEGSQREHYTSQAIDNTIRVLADVSEKMRDAVLLGQTQDLPMNIKSLTDAVTKLAQLQMQIKNGGVDKKEIHIRKEKLDWNQIIEQSLRAKKQQGDNFDSKAFLAHVIDVNPENKDE